MKLAIISGVTHDRANAAQPGYFSYSYGYYFTGQDDIQYGCLMSYIGSRIPYYSTPDVFYEGMRIGIPIGDPDEADNADTIDFTAPIVAGYRDLLGAALENAAYDPISQMFEADIVGPANALCQVLSSSDLCSWSPIAIVTLTASGQGSFSDSTLGTGAKFYRIW